MAESTKVIRREEVPQAFKRAAVQDTYKVTVRKQVYQREEVQRIFREAVNGN